MTVFRLVVVCLGSLILKLLRAILLPLLVIITSGAVGAGMVLGARAGWLPLPDWWPLLLVWLFIGTTAVFALVLLWPLGQSLWLWGQSLIIPKSLRPLLPLLAVIAAFAVGIGIYAWLQAWWPLLLVWWPWLLAGATAVFALGLWWLWWRFPMRAVNRLLLPDPKARADVEDNFRKTIGQLLGGAAVLIGAGFAYLQFQQQQKAASDLLMSNQVSKGFEQIGNKKVEVRLGDIYALEGVMNTSENYYQPVLEALCAFVRDQTKANTGDDAPASDVQAVLTVVGRRRIIKNLNPDLRKNLNPDLRNAHIPKADLEDADLTGAHLDNADLTDAHLTNAHLDRAHLNDADLTRADLDLVHLDLAHLNNAHLSGADLGDAHLYRAHLNGAHLNDAVLTMIELGGAHLDNADLTGAHLEDASLDGVHLRNAHLDGAHLNGANLKGAVLYGDTLNHADLSNAQGLTQEQLDLNCGTDVKGLDQHDPPLKIKPCQ